MDTFFSTLKCDRCGSSLANKPRKMSWFTEETLCPKCQDDELRLRGAFREKGVDDRVLEGLGYVPDLKEADKWVGKKFES